MKIALINEMSQADKNPIILEALKSTGHEIINAGMKSSKDEHVLSYLETSFLAALLLNTKRVDFVVGGCGTGQGFCIAANHYPGVHCGLVLSPLDIWLFAHINGGNCVSLPYAMGFGWGAEVNLRFMFEKFFSVEPGAGYPESRREIQQSLRKKLAVTSLDNFKSLAEIVRTMDEDIFKNTVKFPGVWELLDVDTIEDTELKNALIERYSRLT